MSKVRGVNGQELPVFYGNQAVAQVEKAEGRKLTPVERRVVYEEGFVPGLYYDNKNIPTYGVGQTGEYIKKGFRASYEDHVKKTRRMIPQFDNLPEYMQEELVQSTYRGDLGLSPTARRLFNEGRYEEAAKEFLNHEEYMNPRTSQQIKDRILSVSKGMERMAQEYKNFSPEARRRALQRDVASTERKRSAHNGNPSEASS